VSGINKQFSKFLNYDEANKNVYKCLTKYTLRGPVEDIILNDIKINDPEEKSTFWLLSTALSRFYHKN
jgi:hypothetical protein